MISYRNILNYVDREISEFDDFKGDSSLREYKAIYLNYLAVFYINNINSPVLTGKIATLINKMADSTDLDVQIILDDFILTLYDSSTEKGVDISILYEKLTDKSKNIFDENIGRWSRGND